MQAPPHALTTNGRISDELKGRGDPEEELRRRLKLLDGDERFSLSLWRLPDSIPFDKVDLEAWPQYYIQAAGSADRMIVEVRSEADGVARQFAVGRKSSDVNHGSAAKEKIVWNGQDHAAVLNEIFSAAEAADLFVNYYKNGQVPESYSLRLLLI
jgi:hypothetical protein